MHIKIEKLWSRLNTVILLPPPSQSLELEILPCPLYLASQVFMLLLGVISSSRQEEEIFSQKGKP